MRRAQILVRSVKVTLMLIVALSLAVRMPLASAAPSAEKGQAALTIAVVGPGGSYKIVTLTYTDPSVSILNTDEDDDNDSWFPDVSPF